LKSWERGSVKEKWRLKRLDSGEGAAFVAAVGSAAGSAGSQLVTRFFLPKACDGRRRALSNLSEFRFFDAASSLRRGYSPRQANPIVRVGSTVRSLTS